MNNFLKPALTMTFTAPAGGVTSGSPLFIGGMFCVPTNTVAAGSTFEGDTKGMYTLNKTTGEGALVEGQPLYWDVANAKVTTDHSIGLPIGLCGAAALTGDTTCSVRLNGHSVGGRMFTIRKRFTIAQVNAGATLLPAMPGLKYRMVDCKTISVGGAAAAVTTVDVLATQAAGSVKLVANAQASLVQSAVLTAGGTGAAVLADGASYAQNDVNTAVTVNKTGAAITTAVSIDFLLTYAIE